jgi:hypothetical protein
MSSISTSEDRARREWVRKTMAVVDRVGLGLMYAFVIAVLPFTAAGFLGHVV